MLPHVCSADTVEISVVRNGIILASNIGCNRLMVESVVVEAAKLPDAYMGVDASVVAECKQMVLDFTSVNFVHCCREANEVADILAKHSISSSWSSFWDSPIPDFILPTIINDMSII